MSDLPKNEWLQSFVVFSEKLNLTEAASILHLSQPALHLQLSRLSEQLGTALYRKQGRSLVLTEDGRRVAAFAREQLARTAEFVDELKQGETKQPVVLCAGEGAYLYLLGHPIREFTRARSRPLQLLTRDADATLEAVMSGEAHVGVTATGVPKGLKSAVLTEVGQVLVGPRGYLSSKREVARLKELGDVPLVLPPEGRPHREMVRAAFDAQGVALNVAMEASGWELMLHFVSLGIGLTIVNECCRVPAGLVSVPMPELPKVTYRLLWSSRTEERSAALRKLLLEQKDSWRRSSR
jgi:DNA-binding transcriptional LysR family regulator